MNAPSVNGSAGHLRAELARLELRLARTRHLALGAWLAVAGIAGLGLTRSGGEVQELVRTRALEVVDERGVVRLRLHEDPPDAQRRARSAGLTLFDATGAERGGFSTFEDGSVVLGMDAPAGVGAPMRDRIGLLVGADGSAHVILIDNLTRAVAKLQSDGGGGGGVQVFEWDHAEDVVRVRTLTYAGEEREEVALGR